MLLNIEVIRKTELTVEQQQALAALSNAVYPPKPATSEPINSIHWAATTWSILVWDGGGSLVSHVGALTRTGTHNSTPLLIGGIGGVKTDPSARNQGYASAGLARATEFLQAEEHVAFSLLVCRDELLPYYGRLGWRHFRGDLLVEQPAGKAKFTFNEPMVLAGCGEVPTEGAIDLCGMPW